MIEIMVDNSVHFIGVIADFLSSGVGLLFVSLIVTICIVCAVKSLLS